jgi:hypothetical protein
MNSFGSQTNYIFINNLGAKQEVLKVPIIGPNSLVQTKPLLRVVCNNVWKTFQGYLRLIRTRKNDKVE